jgi:hypothetical protein
MTGADLHGTTEEMLTLSPAQLQLTRELATRISMLQLQISETGTFHEDDPTVVRLDRTLRRFNIEVMQALDHEYNTGGTDEAL